MRGNWRKYISDDDLARGTIESRNFSRCSLVGAALASMRFTECSFSSADLTNARLDDAQFSNCELRHATLQGAVLSGVWLMGCDLSGADAGGAELSGARINKTIWASGILDRADLSKAEICHCNFAAASFRRATLRAVDVADSNFRGAAFTDADVRRRARFDCCDLRDVELTSALLDDARIQRCSVSGVRGRPREPWILIASELDLSREADGSRIGGTAEFIEMLRTQRATRELGAVGELGPARREHDDVVLLTVLDERPALADEIATESRVFPVRTPWFERVALSAIWAIGSKPARFIYAATTPEREVVILDGAPYGLTRAAAAEGLRIDDATAALAYGRFGYQVTFGSRKAAVWITRIADVPWRNPADPRAEALAGAYGSIVAAEFVAPTDSGWSVEAWTVWGGNLARNRILVDRDGAFAIEETVIATDLPEIGHDE